MLFHQNFNRYGHIMQPRHIFKIQKAEEGKHRTLEIPSKSIFLIVDSLLEVSFFLTYPLSKIAKSSETRILPKKTLDCIKSIHYTRHISTKILSHITVFNNNEKYHQAKYMGSLGGLPLGKIQVQLISAILERGEVRKMKL